MIQLLDTVNSDMTTQYAGDIAKGQEIPGLTSRSVFAYKIDLARISYAPSTEGQADR